MVLFFLLLRGAPAPLDPDNISQTVFTRASGPTGRGRVRRTRRGSRMTVNQAAEVWRKRQARMSHPQGKFDRGGRWWPAPEEECSCCAKIRTPSRRWPWSLNKHCRSLEHVANLCGVPVSELRRAVRA